MSDRVIVIGSGYWAKGPTRAAAVKAARKLGMRGRNYKAYQIPADVTPASVYLDSWGYTHFKAPGVSEERMKELNRGDWPLAPRTRTEKLASSTS